MLLTGFAGLGYCGLSVYSKKCRSPHKNGRPKSAPRAPAARQEVVDVSQSQDHVAVALAGRRLGLIYVID